MCDVILHTASIAELTNILLCDVILHTASIAELTNIFNVNLEKANI